MARVRFWNGSSWVYADADNALKLGGTAASEFLKRTELKANQGISLSGTTFSNTDRGSDQSIFKHIANGSGTTQFSAGENADTLRIAGSGATSVTFNAATKTITISSTNTTYSAGNGISLSGTTFSVTAGTGLTQDTNGLSLTSIAAGSSTVGAIRYNGATSGSGYFYGGSTNPTHTTRLNYGGHFYATQLYEGGTRVSVEGHKHAWSDLSGIPDASTTAKGIVQLTSSRASTSTSLALTASAMNSHRSSDDHDSRYYIKSEVDDLVYHSSPQWVVPSDNFRLEYLSPFFVEDSHSPTRLKTFEIDSFGMVRFRFDAYSEGGDDTVSPGDGYVIIDKGGTLYLSGWQHYDWVTFTLDMTSPVMPGEKFSIYALSINEYADNTSGYADSIVGVRNIRVGWSPGEQPSNVRIVS